MVTWMQTGSGCIAIHPQLQIPDRFALYTSFTNRRGRSCRVTKREAAFIEFEIVPPKNEEGGRRAAKSS